MMRWSSRATPTHQCPELARRIQRISVRSAVSNASVSRRIQRSSLGVSNGVRAPRCVLVQEATCVCRLKLLVYKALTY